MATFKLIQYTRNTRRKAFEAPVTDVDSMKQQRLLVRGSGPQHPRQYQVGELESEMNAIVRRFAKLLVNS